MFASAELVKWSVICTSVYIASRWRQMTLNFIQRQQGQTKWRAVESSLSVWRGHGDILLLNIHRFWRSSHEEHQLMR
jgi:hypothetical protein